MARASLNTADILKINEGKIHTFVIVSPDSTDEDDVDLFVVQPPPAVQDATHRAPVDSMTKLCDNCRSAFEYCSHFFDAFKKGGDDAVEKKPPAYLLHAGAQGLQEGDNAGCHLCVLIMSTLSTKWLSMKEVNESTIEMCWQKKSGQAWPARIHFALTHNGHERSAANYWNFFKLKVWPGSEFGLSLFGLSETDSFLLSGRTGSEQSRAKALQWLSRCQANEHGRHTQCNQEPEDWLPTRLLDVTYALETSKLKVVVPHDDPDAFASDRQFITLSHCWGKQGGAAMPVLTTTNLEERQTVGLDISLLPQTFKDALEIAQWFQIRWLWIDSLCILQDSGEDWNQEAVMMYNVYKNALLNISADDSNDPRMGCFRNRDPRAVCPMRLRGPDQPSEDLVKSTYWLTPDSKSLFEGTSAGPLAKRAWVFQERQLSRRVLHFTSSELIWECCAEGQYFACETFPEGAPLTTTFNNRPKFQSQSSLVNASADELYKTWDMLCLAYSEKSLSHIKDKLVALSGLAQEFEAALPNDNYVAGLWRSTLPESLLWTATNNCGRIETSAFIAPSWSWLSMHGPISNFAPRSPDTPVVRIINVAIDPVIPSKPTASLRSASLELQCYLRPIEIRPDYDKKQWYQMAYGGGQNDKLIFRDGGQDLNLGSRRSFSFDVPYDENSGPAFLSCFFLPVCIRKPSESSDESSKSSGSSETVIRGLLVEPVNNDPTLFRRIGMMSLHGAHCMHLSYKLKNGGEDTLWSSLEKLLSQNYESPDSLRAYTENAVDAAKNSSLSSATYETKNRDSGVDGEAKVDKKSLVNLEAKDEHTRTLMTEKETDRDETVKTKAIDRKVVERVFQELDINKEDDVAPDKLLKVPDIDVMDALEKLYAWDAEFYGSHLEVHFERLVPQHITLI